MSFPPTLDTILLIIIIGFTAWGFANGLIRALGGIIGIILGAIIASRYYLPLSEIIRPFFGAYEGLAALVAFVFLFLLIGRLFGVVVYFFEKAFDVLAIIPFLKSINRLAGAIFGFLLGCLIVGTILFVAGKYSQWTAFNDAVFNSQLAQFVLNTSRVVTPLFPEAVRQLRSYF
ncbi:hypothetical protein A3H10_03210 [Candidatus Uhrbacteria bacterium RIFCSPLOWO2_12_FULL_46_10]|nr:MAG: Colicin V production protein [Parcubacteria group bacterium GW2011_GWA2_46_9]OGL76603.1 MAG: hypothetical protein A3E96_00455 [Candidatus Uhrbacteria bacterium RIFCSPHIGHO2_12_FULL_46_13]OGL90765.1 MAG: hypothetical protein A3H10_03210 [Candidatus Uhrbacteria bacterium RIFCSPLOWO2_12_FULL_46_10]